MRNRHMSAFVGAIGLLIAAAPLFAHHANAVFDTEKKVTVKGTVVAWLWANPHCLLRFDVTDEKGEVAHWVGETQAPINMIGNGWRSDSFKAGDEITVTLEPLRNGRAGGSILTVTFPDGKVLNTRSQNIYKPDAAKPDASNPNASNPNAAKPEEDSKP
ncbi:MAG TPA: DUF6152 family protein [Candidatus Acidoferrales bacterium]|nr:DUF6152 family protein [Candidatus Acidoferrales bacterium]